MNTIEYKICNNFEILSKNGCIIDDEIKNYLDFEVLETYSDSGFLEIILNCI